MGAGLFLIFRIQKSFFGKITAHRNHCRHIFHQKWVGGYMMGVQMVPAATKAKPEVRSLGQHGLYFPSGSAVE
jgi:hypothetical protein